MPHRYRIAILVDRWSIGGVPMVIKDHCRLLESQGHKVKVITYYPSNKPEDLHAGFMSLEAKSRGDIKALKTLRSFFDNWQPDVIHDHFGGLWSASFLFNKRWRRRAILHYHNEFKAVSDSPDESRKFRDSIFLRFLLKRYRIVLTVSEHNRQRLLAHSNLVESQAEVCYNSLDKEHFLSSRSQGKDVRKKHGIPGNALFIGSLGRLVYEKGFDSVVETMIALHKKGYKAFVLVAGEGDEEIGKQIEATVADAGLSEFLIRTGKEPNTVDYLKSLDFFLMCSRQEPFGLTILESIACETPVVGFVPEAGGGPTEIISKYKNGVLLEKRNPDELADVIISLFENKSERSKLIKNASDTLNEFHPEKTLIQLEKLYHRVVNYK